MTHVIAGRQVGSTGYGLMGLTWRPEPVPHKQAFAAMRAALAAGCNLWHGGTFYGPSENNSLVLLNKYYTEYPEDVDKVVLNIKGGHKGHAPDGSPAFLRQDVENALKQMGGKGRIDVFGCARRDPNTPLKQTLETLADLVKEGKIGGVSLSEVNANTIKEAAAITKISAVEVELSLWSTEPLTNGIAKVCAELDIPIAAYSPIGRGILTGQIKSYKDIPEGDLRQKLPRFQPENFDVNMKLVKQLEQVAKKKNCTPAQLALGWLIGISKQPGMPEIIPIPGATTVERVEENTAAIELTDGEMEEIQGILNTFEVAGERYHAMGMKFVDA